MKRTKKGTRKTKVVKVKGYTRAYPKKQSEKKITLTSGNVGALKKKYPITFKKLREMAGNPSIKTLRGQLPYYNKWLKMHGYDNAKWFRGRNKSMKDF